MTCIGCDGIGWRRRLVPHPGVPGYMVTETRVCPTCNGKGEVQIIYPPSGKDRAAGEREETT